MFAEIIESRQELIEKILLLRKENKRIVFTNGCFDLMHAGHVAYLQEARSFGDILVVALNDDASVTRLKGAGRPLCSLEDRMMVMAALGCVDIVTCFSEDTPQEIIQSIVPDVLVKGGDYSLDTIVGAQEVMDNGGNVKIVPFVEGKSSTNLIEKIKKI